MKTKKSLEGFKGRFEYLEEGTSKLKDKTMEIIESEKQKKIEEKRTEPKVSIEHHQRSQHAHCRSLRRINERERYRENIGRNNG